MRLTGRLCKQSLRWLLKNEWKRKGVFWQPRLIIPAAFKDKEIIDPVQEYLKPKRIQWTPPVPDDPRFSPPPKLEAHPDYHEHAFYTYSMETRLLEGCRQALLLTKAQPFEGLPPSTESLLGAVEIPYQDELIQRYIMQAHKWDPTKEKLPKRFNSAIPGWKFKREFGIPRRRTMSILVQNLLRLCLTQHALHPALSSGRRHLRDHFYSAHYNFRDYDPIQIKNTCEWLVSADSPLPAFATDDQLDESVLHKLPDLYPVAPTIDLKPSHIYREENVTGFHGPFRHSHPHTIYMVNNDHWSTPERNGRALLMSFGLALARAKELYGEEAKQLPAPICLQCVHTDGVAFHFTAFQLNTLDFTSSDGIKNFVWFDNDNKLFNKIEPKRAMLRNTKYEDYDPEVFKKFLAVYLNGAQLMLQ